MDTGTLPDYREIVQTLDSYANMERVPGASRSYADGTARMARLMKHLGSPHANIPAIHIAGTKGKGSTSHMAAAALVGAGIRTGLYTSPHVETLRERIAVNGRMISENHFVESAAEVLKTAEAMRLEGDDPSWFEIMTAIAFHAFREARVEAMVLETGMGGRLDATNLPDVRVVAVGITAISKDHEAILGDTLAKIAAEKAAIIRDNVPVVVAPQEEGVMRLIRDKAAAMHTRVFEVGKDLRFAFRKRATQDKPGLGQRLDLETWRNVYPDIRIAMLGEHQALNAALALGLADLFLEYMDRDPMDSMALKRSWRNLSLPARMEAVESNPWIVVDGAHNPASAWAAAETLEEAFGPAQRVLVFGCSSDKNHRAMLRILAPLFKQVVLTPFDSLRATPAEELAAALKAECPDVKAAEALDPAHALELAKEMAGPDGVVLVTGSFYLAGEIRALCRRETVSA